MSFRIDSSKSNKTSQFFEVEKEINSSSCACLKPLKKQVTWGEVKETLRSEYLMNLPFIAASLNKNIPNKIGYVPTETTVKEIYSAAALAQRILILKDRSLSPAPSSIHLSLSERTTGSSTPLSINRAIGAQRLPQVYNHSDMRKPFAFTHKNPIIPINEP